MECTGNSSLRGGEICWHCLGDDHWYGVFLELFVLFMCFAALAVVCGTYLNVGLETLCVRWKIREDVAGATVLAVGSATPMIVINAVSVIRSHTAQDPEAIRLGISAIVGSGMVAFLLAPGLCALSSKETLNLKRRPLLRDVLFYAIAVFFLVYFFHDGVISIWEASVLLGIYGAYVLVTIFSPQIRELFRVRCLGKEPRRDVSFLHMERILREEEAEESRQAISARLGPEDKEAEGLYKDEDDEPLWALDSTFSTPTPNPQPDVDEGKGGPPENVVLHVVWIVYNIFVYPVRMILRYLCPNCKEGSKYEALYPITILVSVACVAGVSYLISSIISRWSILLDAPTIILGMTVVSLGAEVPDMMQSVHAARRGYGSLAVSNCIGSKIVNIGLGFGLPWLVYIANSSGRDLPVCAYKELQVAALFHGGAVVVFLGTSLVMALVSRAQKASLTKRKGAFLLATYLLSMGGYILYYYQS